MKNLILILLTFISLNASGQISPPKSVEEKYTIRVKESGEVVRISETELPISTKSIDATIIVLQESVKRMNEKIEKLYADKKEVEILEKNKKQ